MPKVKMLVSIASESYMATPGDVMEFSEAEAKKLVAEGLAVPVENADTKTVVKQAEAKSIKPKK